MRPGIIKGSFGHKKIIPPCNISMSKSVINMRSPTEDTHGEIYTLRIDFGGNKK